MRNLLPLLLLGLTGCCGADNAFTTAADSYSQTVGETWTTYVTNDPKLTPLEKQSRLDTHIRFREAVAAKKAADAANQGVTP